MSTHTTGRRAEEIAAEYLESLGFTILALNWRTSACEVDIIARKQQRFFRASNTVYFIEVKYRRSSYAGDGFSAITKSKLRRLQNGVQHWIRENSFDGDVRVLVVALSGQDFTVDGVIELTFD